MRDESIEIRVHVPDPLAVSPRLRDALAELSSALEADGLVPEQEVTGFAVGLTIGDLLGGRPGVAPGTEESCWGYCKQDADCGGMYCWWYSSTQTPKKAR